jgi:hypothetical protein
MPPHTDSDNHFGAVFEGKTNRLIIRQIQFTKKNSLFLKKSNARFFQKQAVFFSKRRALSPGGPSLCFKSSEKRGEKQV